MLKVTVTLSLPTWKVPENPDGVEIEKGLEIVERKIEFCCSNKMAYDVFNNALPAAHKEERNNEKETDG